MGGYLGLDALVIDVVISVAACIYLPFVIMHKHETQLESMTAAWLLPMVSTIVVAASGGIVVQALPNPQHALWTLITSYILWGTGVPLVMVVLVMYFHRLTVHKLPPREVIVSAFLPLGPLGQGGFVIMLLGKGAMDIFPKTNSLALGSGKTLYTMGFGLALIMWGYGLVWLFFALATISRTRFPFNLGWKGFTFPLGVFTVSTVTIAKESPSLFFNVLGTIFSLSVILLWIVVSVGTVRGALVTGNLLFAPCAAEYEKAFNLKEAEKHEHLRNGAAAV